MGFFRKAAPPSNELRVSEFSNLAFKAVWERKNPPNPGADVYAWETLQQAPYTPIGAGVHAISQRLRPIGPPPLMTQQGVIVIGVPTTAGQIWGAPLVSAPATSNIGGQV